MKRFIRFFCRPIAVVFFILAIALIWFWVRSYETAERVHGRAWAKESFLIASKQGRTTWLWFTSHGHDQWWQWETRSFPADDEMSFPVGPVRQYESRAGFGRIENPIYFVMPSTIQNADGTQMMMLGAATATLRGSGLIVPFWFLVLSLLLLAILLSSNRIWQFGMRRLLLIVTVVGLVLALMTVLDSNQPAPR